MRCAEIFTCQSVPTHVLKVLYEQDDTFALRSQTNLWARLEMWEFVGTGMVGVREWEIGVTGECGSLPLNFRGV